MFLCQSQSALQILQLFVKEVKSWKRSLVFFFECCLHNQRISFDGRARGIGHRRVPADSSWTETK